MPRYALSLTVAALVAALGSAADLGAQTVDPTGRSILFIRGAYGTGGATEGGTPAQRTEQLSDVTNTATNRGNHGWGTLASHLAADGFRVQQRIESPSTLTLAALLPHRVVVFGSNNRTYSAAEVSAFHAYMDAGGSALFASDANWGLTWEAAPASDNPLLARYGAQVYQDSGQVPNMKRSETGRYRIPDHPVLSGPGGVGGTDDVDQYNGEGVSLFRITSGANGYQAVPLVAATGLRKRLNNPQGGPGSLQLAGTGDAAMILVEKGDTRLVGHYDRNTFFNLNGAGTDIFKLDNAKLALGIFRFLVSVKATTATAGIGCGARGPVTLSTTAPILGRTLVFTVKNATASVPGLLVIAPGDPFPQKLPGGCVVQIPAVPAMLMIPFVTDATGGWSGPLPLPAAHPFSGFRFTAQAITFAPRGPLPGGGELTNGVALRLGFPR